MHSILKIKSLQSISWLNKLARISSMNFAIYALYTLSFISFCKDLRVTKIGRQQKKKKCICLHFNISNVWNIPHQELKFQDIDYQKVLQLIFKMPNKCAPVDLQNFGVFLLHPYLHSFKRYRCESIPSDKMLIKFSDVTPVKTLYKN